MAAILASQLWYGHNSHLFNQGKTMDLLRIERQRCDISMMIKNKKGFRFQVKMQHTEVPSRFNGQKPVKMVPASEIVTSRKQTVHETSLVKRNYNSNSSLLRVPKGRLLEDLPPIADESFSWANENYSAWQRSIDVWSSVISLQIRLMLNDAKWTYFGGFTEDKQKNRRRRTASWLRERALHLGPTFIKLGQLYSSRADLFPSEFVEELAKLQDKCPAFSPEKARHLIDTELGAPVDQLFRIFEDQPIAAASLGQVHRAILHNGEKVVVKVQRPGLKKLFDIDLRTLKLIAEHFQGKETFGGPIRDWVGIYEECARILYQEIDYINEGKNADRFRRDFRNIKWVRVPLVYWDYTASKVLTLEYVPGIKLNELDAIDLHGFSRAQISSRVVEAYFIQILKTGFFHADPHPGNLAIDVNESIIYYDFGMMGEIKSFTRDKLLKLFYAVYEKDVKKVIQSLIDLEALQPTGDKSSVKRVVQVFLDNLLSQTPDQQKILTAIGEDLFALAHDQPFQFPSTFAFMLRAFSTMEGNVYLLDPNFSLLKVAAPYAQELFHSRENHPFGTQLVEKIRKQTDDARAQTISMPYRVQHIEEFVEQLEAGDIRLRVRVLESERAAQKATMLQMAIMYTVFGTTLLNLGVTFVGQACQLVANGCFMGAGVFFTLFLWTIQKMKMLDEFEQMI